MSLLLFFLECSAVMCIVSIIIVDFEAMTRKSVLGVCMYHLFVITLYQGHYKASWTENGGIFL